MLEEPKLIKEEPVKVLIRSKNQSMRGLCQSCFSKQSHPRYKLKRKSAEAQSQEKIKFNPIKYYKEEK